MLVKDPRPATAVGVDGPLLPFQNGMSAAHAAAAQPAPPLKLQLQQQLQYQIGDSPNVASSLPLLPMPNQQLQQPAAMPLAQQSISMPLDHLLQPGMAQPLVLQQMQQQQAIVLEQHHQQQQQMLAFNLQAPTTAAASAAASTSMVGFPVATTASWPVMSMPLLGPCVIPMQPQQLPPAPLGGHSSFTDVAYSGPLMVQHQQQQQQYINSPSLEVSYLPDAVNATIALGQSQGLVDSLSACPWPAPTYTTALVGPA